MWLAAEASRCELAYFAQGPAVATQFFFRVGEEDLMTMLHAAAAGAPLNR